MTLSIKAAIAAAGEIDVLVNSNAGIGVGGPIECVLLDRGAKAMFETNVWGPARMVQAIAPAMRARERGAIVNVTSLAGPRWSGRSTATTPLQVGCSKGAQPGDVDRVGALGHQGHRDRTWAFIATPNAPRRTRYTAATRLRMTRAPSTTLGRRHHEVVGR